MTYVKSWPFLSFHYRGGRNSNVPRGLLVTQSGQSAPSKLSETPCSKNRRRKGQGVIEEDSVLLLPPSVHAPAHKCAHTDPYTSAHHTQAHQLIHLLPDMLQK